MEQLDFTLLNVEQIRGNGKLIDRNRLDIFKKYGVTASITDYAILLGGNVSLNYVTDGCDLENRNGHYWTSNAYEYNNIDKSTKKSANIKNVFTISTSGTTDIKNIALCFVGCRPAARFLSFKEISSKIERRVDGLVEIEYGEYPQKACNKSLQDNLEQSFQNKELEKTGKRYKTILSSDIDVGNYDEYIHDGKKYIRVKANLYQLGYTLLSNGVNYKYGDVVWVEVSPIKWLVDERKKIMVAKHILFAGIPFNDRGYYVDFNSTTLKWYLDNFFSKEIIMSLIKKKNDEIDSTETTSEEKIIDEIKEQLKLIEIHKNKVNEITARVNTLLDKYDILIKNTSNNSLLVLGDSTLSGLKNKRIIELQEILDDLKKLTSSLKIYYDMRDYIRDLIRIKDGEEVELNTELKNDFNAIYNVILPFLETAEQSQIKEMLRKFLWNEYERVWGIIKQIINNEQLDKDTYKNIDELELELRNKLHPILEILNKEVLKRDVSKSILEGTKAIIQNNYKISKNNIISFYINIINDIYQKIKYSFVLNENEEQQLIEIVQMNIDTNKDINEIIKQLMVIINNLYNFMFDLQEREEKENIIKKHCIKIRL